MLRDINCKKNLEKFLIIVLMGSCIFNAAFGFLNIDLGVLILTPMRFCLLLVTVCCVVIWFYRFIKKELKRYFKEYKFRLVVFLFFVIWSAIGIFWLLLGEDVIDLGITEVVAIITLCLYAFCFFTLVNSKENLKLVFDFLLCSGLVLSLLALIEIIIGSPLESSAYYYSIEERASLGITLFPPSTVFHNTNDLGAFILMCVPIILFRFLRSEGKKNYIISFVLMLVLLLPIPIINSSIFEISFTLLLIVVALIIFLFRDKSIIQSKRKFFWLIILKIVQALPLKILIKDITTKLNYHFFAPRIQKVLPYINSNQGDNVKKVLENNARAIEQSLGGQVDALRNNVGTIFTRLNLIKAGIDYTFKSPWFGCGPAGFRKLIKKDDKYLYLTNNIVDPHNYYIELLAQYGIFLFIFYFIIYLFMFISCIKNIKREIEDRKPGKGVFILLLLIAFAFAAMMPSGFIRFISIWLFFFGMVSVHEIVA